MIRVRTQRNRRAWGAYVAAAMAVLSSQASAASLLWSPLTNNLWNATTPNWVGDRTTFQAGDAVLFADGLAPGTAEVVIAPPQPAMDPAMFPVFPSATTISNESTSYVFTGGAIESGSLIKTGNGSAKFQGGYFSTPSHAFDGGTFLRGGLLSFEVRRNDAGGYRFGLGPIEIDGGAFELHVRYRLTEFKNVLHVSSQGGQLVVTRDFDLLPILGSARSTGNLYLDGPLSLDGLNDDLDVDQIDGRVIVNQSSVGPRALDFENPMELSGPIVDGPGTAANPLLLANRAGFLRVLGVTGPSNTYAGGTIIGTTRQSTLNHDLIYYAVEVAPASSLGTGPVLVESNAVLRLLGNNNLNTNSYLNIQGAVFVASNVTIQVTELALGTNVYRNGSFTAANSSGHIFGAGSIRVVSHGRGIPVIESIRRESSVRVVVSFKAEPFKAYSIETTDSLISPNWTVAATIPADRFPRMMAVTYSLSSQEASRFFRLISRPGD